MGITEKPKRGEIWYIENDCDFIGREVGYTRPAIIVSNDTNNKFSSVVEVVYLTTNQKKETTVCLHMSRSHQHLEYQ